MLLDFEAAKHARDQFSDLPPVELHLLEVIAVSIVAMTRSQQVAALRRLGVRAPNGKPLSTKNVDPLLGGLAEAGLIDPERLDCPLEVEDALTRRLMDQGRYAKIAAAVSAACPLDQVWNWRDEVTWKHRGMEHFIREIRIAVHAQDWERVREVNHGAKTTVGASLIAAATLLNRDLSRLDLLPEEFASEAIRESILESVDRLRPQDEVMGLGAAALAKRDHGPLRLAMVEAQVFTGALEHARQTLDAATDLDPSSAIKAKSLRALLLACAGDHTAAAKAWGGAVSAARKATGRRGAYLWDSGGLFFPFSLVASGNLKRAFKIATQAWSWTERAALAKVAAGLQVRSDGSGIASTSDLIACRSCRSTR